MSALPSAASSQALAAEPVWAWGAEALQARLEPARGGLRVDIVDEVDSTSTRLLEAARSGDMQPRLLVAERQTAGRGRMGRRWWSGERSPRGPSSLSFSLGLGLAPHAWSGLSLAVGVALAEALDPHGLHGVRLKWPNDLWLGDAQNAPGRKFAGVLIETVAVPGAAPALRHAVIGVGLNLDPPDAEAGLAASSAGWREAEPDADAPGLLARLAQALFDALAQFESAGFAAFAERYAQRDGLAGRRIAVASKPPLAGLADGVDATGALRLMTEAGLRLIDSAEVSVRPC